nr:phage tail tape measure protein [Streptomyces boncukensis]
MKTGVAVAGAAVAAGVAGIGVAAVKTAGDFEAGMNRVKAVSGATGAEFTQLEDLAKKLGSTTQFSATEAAEAMGFLSMAGFDAKDTMTALPGVLDLAAAGAIGLGDAADIASNILSGYGMKTKDIGRLNDVLAKTFTSANVDMQMLGESFKYVGPVAASAGIKFEETSAAIGLLGNAGIQGSEAGTALRGSIANLLKPSAEAAETLDKLGVSVTDSHGELLPLVDIVEQLEKSGAKTADMMSIFGLEAGPAMQALVSQGSGALRDLTQDLETSGGTASKIAKTQNEGLNGSIKALKSAWEGLLIAIGDSGLLDGVTALTEKATGLVSAVSKSEAVTEGLPVALGAVESAAVSTAGGVKAVGGALADGARWVRDYGAWLLPFGVALAGIGVTMGASAAVTGVTTAAISAYRGVLVATAAVTRGYAVAQGVLNAVMNANPVGLIITGILALGTALVVAYNKSETFRNIVQGAWSGIQTAASFAWSYLQPVISGIWTGLQAIGSAASWLWTTVLAPVFSAIGLAAKVLFAVVVVAVITPMVLAFKVLGAVAGWLWNAAIGPAFRGIVALASWWWAGVKLYFGLVKAGFTGVGRVGMWLYRNAIQPAFRGIVAVASWWWSGVKVYFGLVKAGMRAVGAVGTWLYRNAIQPAFRGIGSAASWLWSKALKPALDAGKRGVALFGGAFDTAKTAIDKAWSQVSKIAAKPVNFIIEFVYTKGIKAVWDKVAGFVGLGKLPKAPKLLASGGTLGDEWGPARPMKVNRPTAIVGEGDPRHPEYVIPTDPKYRGRARALWEAAGHQLMADGGVLGKLKGWGSSAVDWTVDKAKKIGGVVMDGVRFLSHPGKMWDKATKFVRDKIAKIGESKWAKVAGRIPLKMLTGLKDKIVGAATSFFGGGGSTNIGGSGVKHWAPLVLQALRMVGQPASLLNTVLRRMNQESGGNPRAINRWDVNARNGTPSKGLMQVIDPTFRAYAGRLRGRGVWDPLANIYASMRYALSRYGSLSRAYNRRGGYATGGRPRPGELAWVGEEGPELVRFGGGARVWDSRSSLGGVQALTAATERLADEVGAARVGGVRAALSQLDTDAVRRMAAAVLPVTGQQPHGGFEDGQQLALVLADGTQLDAYVDTRVDAGLTTARQRSRAGAKRR